MLTLTFLGVGSAFAKRNYQSNALLEAWSAPPSERVAPDDVLLIDFGATGPMALYRLRQKAEFTYLDYHGSINYPVIRRVLITHLHGDHIAGLEELAGMNMHCFGGAESTHVGKPELIGTADVIERLWENSLRGGLGAVSGKRAKLTDYFDVHCLRPMGNGTPDRVTLSDRYDVGMFPTDHIQIRDKYDWPSYGVLITERSTGASVFYSGDTRFDSAAYGPMMTAAKLNFHEVQLEEHPSPVHAVISDLRTLPEDIRQKTWLYHFSDAWDSGDYAYVAEEFAGFARPQVRYTLFD